MTGTPRAVSYPRLLLFSAYVHPLVHFTLVSIAISCCQFLPNIYFCLPAFSDTTDSGGEFNIMTAGEFDSFSPVRTGLKAGSRPLSSDGLATFGGVRALARYVKVEAVPASGGTITINEVRHLACCHIEEFGFSSPFPRHMLVTWSLGMHGTRASTFVSRVEPCA